jgi:hypothetical protein
MIFFNSIFPMYLVYVFDCRVLRCPYFLLSILYSRPTEAKSIHRAQNDAFGFRPLRLACIQKTFSSRPPPRKANGKGAASRGGVRLCLHPTVEDLFTPDEQSLSPAHHDFLAVGESSLADGEHFPTDGEHFPTDDELPPEVGLSRQAEGEGGAGAGLALHGDLPAVGLHDRLGHAQAQSVAGVGGVPAAVKALPDVRAVLGQNAGA